MRLTRPVIQHHTIEIFGLNSDLLDDIDQLERLSVKFATRVGLDVLEKHSRRFQPNGLTLVFILSASHLVIHSWPERNYLHLDLMRCDQAVTREATAALAASAIKIFGTREIFISPFVYPTRELTLPEGGTSS